ncbi:hypothetical protein DPEC_G00005110 [Dallia pectoralis]|uniref:Uncharacterized protein n=1 Tax=Dallia pectoralis TaxID=75939 RepID=A0ACC2HKM0_DALPE|nr:hypothetical protein DPEC_G00005110 [Dallia pectoralis]
MGTTACLLMTLFLGILSGEELLHRQKRIWIVDTFKIEEGKRSHYPYVLGKIVTEKKYQVGFFLHGDGVDLEPKDKLSINTTTGEIFVKGELDYEFSQLLKLTFEAKNIVDNTFDTRLGVEVEILDINDNPPVFQRSTYTINLTENTLPGVLERLSASDRDRADTNNGTFNFKIVSVTPKPPEDLEFFLEQKDTIGKIQFRGCLDYKKSNKYTILVEAKDRGEKIQLSSTCTVVINIKDGNNNMPVFKGQTGAGSIKERDSGVEVLRLQVYDQDIAGSDAWKAKYTIHGDKDQNFRITTDPKTNEGVLLVEKPLDYEDGSLRNLSVSVENEELYFSCKVKRPHPNSQWIVETSQTPPPLSTRQLTIKVEDVNDPPIFTPVIKNVSVDENVAVGWNLVTFTAKDSDQLYANSFLYVKGNDPGQWVAVDAKTGKITTTKILDRESPHVKNGVYQVTVLAVDNGTPPMTGTGTLNIHLKDTNDNRPQLGMSNMDMCLSDEPSTVNITAYDLDGYPYSGPFRFQLHGDDVMGKWRVVPDYGYTVSLVKENTVYAGHHELVLEVFDQQGLGALHNLSITVCECSGAENCRMRRSSGASFGANAVLILMAAILLLLGILLLSFLMTCKRKPLPIPTDEYSAEHLIKFNVEAPGTDCKVPTAITQVDNKENTKVTNETSTNVSALPPSWQVESEYAHNSWFERGTRLRESESSKIHSQGFGQGSMNSSRNIKRGSSWREENYMKKSHQLMLLLNKKMYLMQVPGEELGDYAPNPYSEEGDLETDHQLDAISIPDTPFDQDTLLDLGPKFNPLASICKTPDLSAS